MTVVAVFAAAGITTLARVMRANGGVTAATSVIASSIFVLVIARLPLVNVSASLFGGDHAIAGLIVGRLLTFLSLIVLATLLMLSVSALEHRQYGSSPKGVLLARATILAITLLLAPNFGPSSCQCQAVPF